MPRQRQTNRNRQALFGSPGRSTSARRTNYASLAPPVRPENAERALEEAVFREQELRSSEALMREQAKVQRATNTVLHNTKTILTHTSETLTLSRQMHRGIDEIRRMLSTPGGAASLLMNPFFSLIVFFLAHPYLPVSVETVMPVWSVVLSVNYVKRITTRIAKGETILDIGGRGVLGTVRSLVFSAPHAVVLMYKLGTLWTEERTGTRGFSSQNATAFRETTAASDWEPFLMETFTRGMETLRSMNLQSVASAASTADIPAIPPFNITEWRTYLESAGERVYTDVRALDPELFKDKAGCIQLILQYVGGKLAVRGKGVAEATLNMPAYLHQARTVLAAEQWILQCLIHLLNDICHQVFRDLWTTTTTAICTALCSYETIMPPPPVESVGSVAGGGEVGGGLTDWLGSPTTAYETITEKITTGTAKATQYMLETTIVKTITEFDYVGTLLRQIARFACDCRKFGKVKMDGGSPSRTRKTNKSTKSRRSSLHSRSSTRRSAKSRRRSSARARIPENHADFLRVSLQYVLLTLSPLLTGLPVFPTPASSVALDAAMRELLLKKVETGQFVPPVYMPDIGVRHYFLGN